MWYRRLRERVAAGEWVALATVVAAREEAGGWVGRKALVGTDGQLTGSLDGGGPLDRWLRALSLGAPGEVDWVALDLRAAGAPHLSAGPGRPPLSLPLPGAPYPPVRVWVEIYAPPPELLVLGAGHLAQPISRIGKLLGFTVTVVDDRPAYANRERFPEADAVLACDFGELLQQVTVTPRTYAVIVTRGHLHDAEVLRALLPTPAAYLGMIGSRRRVKAVLDALLGEGFSPHALARLHAPIGLDIGAETPPEIAVSVMAEIVKVRRGGSAASLSLVPRLLGLTK